MLNHIVVMGRLTRDPELKRTESGLPVTRFSIACDRDFKDRNTGEKQVDFVDCVAWRTTAEFVAKNFAKGRMAVVDGRLQSRKYTDKNGQNRVAWEVLANSVYFGDSKPDGGNGNQSGYNAGYGNAPGYSANQSGNAPGYGNGGNNDYYASPSGEFKEAYDEDGDLPF